MVSIFVPNIPEFSRLLHAAQHAEGCEVNGPTEGYWTIVASDQLRFVRKELGLGPALWNSALSGGFVGRISEYSADVMCVVSEDSEVAP